MRFLPGLFSLFLFWNSGSALFADDGKRVVAPRQEFRRSAKEPFVFVPVQYLPIHGPVALRFQKPVIACGEREAPLLPKPAEAQPKESPAPSASPAPSPAQAAPKKEQILPEPSPAPVPAPSAVSAQPLFPVPENAPDPNAKATPDFTKIPDEVLGYFVDEKQGVKRRTFILDPIFEPVPVAQPLPSSAAKYKTEK